MTNPLNLNNIEINDLQHLKMYTAADSNRIRGYGRRFTVIDSRDGSKTNLVFKNLVQHAKTLAKRAETTEELNEVYEHIGKLKEVESLAKDEYSQRGSLYKFRSWFHRLFGGAFFGSHTGRLNQAESKLAPKFLENISTILKESGNDLPQTSHTTITVNNKTFVVNLTHNDEGLSKLEVFKENKPEKVATFEVLTSNDVRLENVKASTPLFHAIIKELNHQKDLEKIKLETIRTGKSHYTKIELNDKEGTENILKITKIKNGIFVDKTFFREKKLGEGGMGTAYQYAEIDAEGNPVVGAKPKVVKVAHDSSSAKMAMSDGFEIMKDQFVDDKGKPVAKVPGLIKPTKSQIGDIALLSLYGSGHAGVKGDDTPNEFNESVNFIKQVCFGLNHMHTKIEATDTTPEKRAIVHRDIKGENIFCRKETHFDDQSNSYVTVMKYGLADYDGAHEAHIDQKTTFTHTKAFISLSDVLLINNASVHEDDIEDFNKSLDVYALGIAFREFLTGVSIDPSRDNSWSSLEEKALIDRNYKNLREPLKYDDFPLNYRMQLSNDERIMLNGLILLCNQMTRKDWEMRPTASQCLRQLQNLGIELPTYT